MNTYFCTHHKQLLLYSNLFLSFAMMGQGTAIYADTLTSNSEPNNTYFQTQTLTTRKKGSTATTKRLLY